MSLRSAPNPRRTCRWYSKGLSLIQAPRCADPQSSGNHPIEILGTARGGNNIANQTRVLHRLAAVGKALTTLAALTFLLALVAMPLERRFPVLHPFVFWTLLTWWYLFLGTMGVAVVAFLIAAPAVGIYREMFHMVQTTTASRLETNLTHAWAAVAAVMLGGLLALTAAAIVLGYVTQVKLWFVVICWTALVIPWFIFGKLVRWAIRRLEQRGKGAAIEHEHEALPNTGIRKPEP